MINVIYCVSAQSLVCSIYSARPPGFVRSDSRAVIITCSGICRVGSREPGALLAHQRRNEDLLTHSSVVPQRQDFAHHRRSPRSLPRPLKNEPVTLDFFPPLSSTVSVNHLRSFGCVNVAWEWVGSRRRLAYAHVVRDIKQIGEGLVFFFFNSLSKGHRRGESGHWQTAGSPHRLDI